MPSNDQAFDPRATLASLERSYVNYVDIGGLARALCGADEITQGVDICPSFGGDNIERLGRATSELDARQADGREFVFSESTLGVEDVITFSTHAGELKVVSSPAGAPNGFADLRRAATKEHLGYGLQPFVALVGDLARMAAALHRDQDVVRLPELRRVMELEVDRELTVTPPVRGPSSVSRARADREHVERERQLER